MKMVHVMIILKFESSTYAIKYLYQQLNTCKQMNDTPATKTYLLIVVNELCIIIRVAILHLFVS